MQDTGVTQRLSQIGIAESAALMVDAYQGTLDWQEGDNVDVARAEIENVFSNKHGQFLESASLCVVDNLGAAKSQIACCLIESEPTILFVYTSSRFKRQGLAEVLIRQVAYELNRLGFETVSLFVTAQNPALNLYVRLGFEQN